MGEAKRKAIARRKADEEARLGPPISTMPDDIKQDIAQIAGAVHYTTIGGTCHFRALTGMFALKLAGIDAQRCVGGMLYRAGHDERRDVVAFCGPGNAGCFRDGLFLGHMWLRAGDALIDFSSAEWCSASRILHATHDDGMEEIEWVTDPPPFFWGPFDSFMMPVRADPETNWTPELGHAWYNGFKGTAEERHRLDDISDEVKPVLEMTLRRQIEMAKRLEIKSRIVAWRTKALADA